MATETTAGTAVPRRQIECVKSVGIGTEEHEHESAQGEKIVIHRDGRHVMVLFDEDGLSKYEAKFLLICKVKGMQW
jgi:hypothetical protein